MNTPRRLKEIEEILQRKIMAIKLNNSIIEIKKDHIQELEKVNRINQLEINDLELEKAKLNLSYYDQDKRNDK